MHPNLMHALCSSTSLLTLPRTEDQASHSEGFFNTLIYDPLARSQATLPRGMCIPGTGTSFLLQHGASIITTNLRIPEKIL
jgi:hypothetical protein